MRLPGDRVRSMAARLCSARMVARIIDPAIADLQHEYQSARGDGHRWRARRALFAGYVGLAKVLIICALRPFTDAPTASDRGALHAAGRTALVTLVVVTVLLMLPPMQGMRVPAGASRTAFILLLVPQAVPVAIPFALSLGILYGMRGRSLTPALVWGVMAVGALGCLASLAFMEWAIPEANQAWRELMAGAGIQIQGVRGVGETSLSELFGRTDRLSVQTFHIRAALGVAAMVLSILAMAFAPFIRRRTTATLCAVGCAVAYIGWVWIVDWAAPAEWISVAWAAWMPNVLLAGLGVLVLLLRREHRQRDQTKDSSSIS